MDFISIITTIMPFAVVSVLIMTAVIICYLVYRKLFHGKQKINKKQGIIIVLILGWAITVLGLTTLSRGANYGGNVNFSMFSGYINT